MPDERTFLASARSLYFAFQDKRLQPHQRKLVGTALESLKRTDERSWSVLNDAYVLGKEDINWVDEERAVWRLVDLFGAVGLHHLSGKPSNTPKETERVSA